MSKPICRHCVAKVQLFKRCRNLSAGNVLQRCSCLRGVATYLPALCCRGAAVLVVLKPICGHCVAEVQLFKRCSNLTAEHFAAGLQLFKRCPILSASTVLQRSSYLSGLENLFACTVQQGCSYLSGVKTSLPGLCCRGAAV